MKLGLVLPGFSASEDDWCIPALLKLVRQLARQDEVHVFALRYPRRRCAYSVYGATVHALGGADARDLARVPLLGRALWTIVREHRRRRFDILHGFWADEPGFLAVAAGRLLGAPSVVSLLGGELVGFRDIGYGSDLSRVNRRMVRAALAGAGSVTAGSDYVRRLAEPYVVRKRLQLLPIGVDAGLFRPNGIPSADLEGRIRLLHVASLVPVKDQAVLMRAFAHIRNLIPPVHLHIVGGGPLRGELEGLAGALGIASGVKFHGPVSHDRLPDFYHAADLCLLSSRHEGQEWVTQEAAACSRSTVGTAVGVVPDMVPATRAVPVGDFRALAEETVGLLRNPRGCRVLGQAAREQFERRYTLEGTVQNLTELYGKVRTDSRARAVA